MKDFLADNNQCGQAILRLVARGNSVITELLRLIDFIPPVFKQESKDDVIKYGELMSDFSYFSNAEVFDFKVESNQVSDNFCSNVLYDTNKHTRSSYPSNILSVRFCISTGLILQC